MKPLSLLAFRFILALLSIVSVWIASVVFRIGPSPDNQVTLSIYFLVITSVAFFITTIRLYETGAISTIFIYACCILIIAYLDHLWEIHGYFDDYKGIKNYTYYPVIVSSAIALSSFLLQKKNESNGLALVACWMALLVAVLAIGTRIFSLGYGMIGTRYIGIVVISLVAAEIVRQYRRWQLQRQIWQPGRDDL